MRGRTARKAAPGALGHDPTDEAASAGRLERAQALLESVRASTVGGATKAVGVGLGVGGIGLVARKRIPKGRPIVGVPLEMCVEAPPQPEDDAEPWPAALAAALLEGARCAEYVDTLPPIGSGALLGELHSAREQLHVASALDAVKRLERHAAAVADKTGATERDARWAVEMVKSRALRLPPERRLLVPVIDLCAHAENATCTWRWHAREDSVVLVTLVDVPKGAELTLNYGARPAEEWLVHYGMDVVEAAGGEVLRDHFRLFDSLPDVARWVGKAARPDAEKLAAAVSAHKRQGGLTLGVDASGKPCEVLWLLLDAMGVNAGDAIRRRVSEILTSYPTSVVEDAEVMGALLEQGEGNTPLAAAVRLRMHKKRLLASVLRT